MTAISKISATIPSVFRRVAAVLLLAGAAACVKDPVVEPSEPEPSGPVLRLSTGSSFTRGDEHYADDPYAENMGEEAIRRVDLFFFEQEQTTEKSFYTWEMKNLSHQTTADLTVKVPIELLDKFRGEKAYVYALVNLPDAVTVDTAKGEIGGRAATLAALAEVWVSAPEFAGAGTAPAVPESFVMRGGSQVDLSVEGQLANVSGTIRLERLASKIRLWAEIPEVIYLDENGKTLHQMENETAEAWEARRAEQTVETWRSVPVDEQTGASNTALYLYNLTTRGRIDAYLGSYEERSAASNPWGYRNIDRSEAQAKFARPLIEDAVLNEIDRDEKYTYSHSVPFYSYPNRWNSTTPVEEHQTYVIITLPWVRQDDNGNELFQLCYYQVPVNALVDETNARAADRLDPNRYYRIKIRIGMLGSKDLGNPTEVEASCEAVEWSTNDVDVSIKDRRYLVVNQKEWVMNNEYELDIPFSTSHKAIVTACYVTYFRYNDIWGTDDDAMEGSVQTHNKEEFDVWLAAANGEHKDYEPGLAGGLEGEGPITARYREEPRDEIYREDLLYYKKSYFYDSEYAEMKEPSRGFIGFRYYVGHEHPKTFQPEAVGYYNEKLMVPYTRRKLVKNGGRATEQNVTVSVEEQKRAWVKYNSNPLYEDINAVYTCTVNDERSVIHLVHPLVRWDEVRKDTTINNKTFNKVRYYVPVLNDATGNTYEEFSRCEIVIKIRHADWEKNDGLYEETVYITQYPGMYIEVSHDYGAVHASSSNSATQRTYNQYVLVNGNDIWTSSGSTNDWYEPNKDQVSTVSGSNYNPNMYVIHTTQLSEEFKDVYIIGDPRTLYYNNVLTNASFTTYKSENSTRADGTPTRWSDDDEYNNLRVSASEIKRNAPAWWISRDVVYVPATWNSLAYYAYSNYKPVTSLYKDKPKNSNGSDTDFPTASSLNWSYVNHKNNLCYYYPTDETLPGETGAKDRFIAPAFRIASSFGKVGSITIGNDSKTKARRRCATYQEAGRPAGRWRLPTRAEIEYIAQLSADGKIPILFGNSSDKAAQGHYWSATGPLLVDGLGNVDEGTENSGDYYSPRCVYDEWYWTQINEKLGYEVKPRETEFIWGDVPKDNTQVETLLNKDQNEK